MIRQSPEQDARLSWTTVSRVTHILKSSSCRPFPDHFLFCLIPFVITVYMIAGYYVILAPGHLYDAIVSENWELFRTHIIRYLLIATAVLALRLIRGILRKSCANILRNRLTSKLHYSYLTNASTNNTKYQAPYYLFSTLTSSPDNPDQRIATDTRLFSFSLLDIVAGPDPDMGGMLEAFASLAFYSYNTYQRTGLYGLLIAYFWSILVCLVTVRAVNFTTPSIFRQERLEADLRFRHAGLRKQAEPVALLRGAQYEYRSLGHLLQAAVKNTWSVIFRTTVLNFVQYGFGYYMSIVMYFTLAIAIGTIGGDGIGYDSNWSPGKKAMWISQTGSVFLQLLYSFTMIVQLGGAVSEFTSHAHRVWEIVDSIDFASPIQSNAGDDQTPLISDLSNGTVTYGELYQGIVVQDLRVWAGGKKNQADLEVGGSCNTRLLGPVSFKVAPGEWTLLQGKSGSGKTSVVRVLRGLWESAGGTATIPRGTLFCPQTPYIASGIHTLREVVLYPHEPDGSEKEARVVSEALDVVGWPGFTDINSVDGTADWAHRTSPGEKQMLAAARVLVAHPAFVVLDEPTSSLDPEAEARIILAIKQAGISGLTVAHSVSLRRFHDSIVEMRSMAQ